MLLLEFTITAVIRQSGEVVCVGTFGERLQREREMRGITLDEIAEATKIGTRSLRALEEQDFDKLPGGIFNKGFVRAYSKYLGIDEDQAVADYVVAVSEAQAAGKLTRSEYAPPEPEPDTGKAPVHIPWGVLILIALAVALAFAAKSYYAKYGWAKLRRQPLPAQTVKAATQQNAGSPSEPVSSVQPAAAATTAQPNPIPAATGGFDLKIRATEEAWVQVTVDGKTVADEVMKANTDRVVHAEKQIVFVTGNAAGIELSEARLQVRGRCQGLRAGSLRR